MLDRILRLAKWAGLKSRVLFPEMILVLQQMLESDE